MLTGRLVPALTKPSSITISTRRYISLTASKTKSSTIIPNQSVVGRCFNHTRPIGQYDVISRYYHTPPGGHVGQSATMAIGSTTLEYNIQTRSFTTEKINQTGSLYIGQTIVVNKTFPFDDVRQFAALTHDTNPLHLNEDYAQNTRFGARVVHGIFVLGFVSGVLGTKMPGIGTILISHDVRYPNPTFVGDTVSCKAEVTEIGRGRRVTVHVTCTSLEQDHTVLEGDVLLKVTKQALPPKQ